VEAVATIALNAFDQPREPGNFPAVSVVIPTRQRRDSLRRALDSLAVQTVPAAEYEVVVSVDGSTDGTREMLAAWSAPFALRVTSSERRGRAAACNAGLKLVRGEVLIILDDDMQVVPEFVERHRRHHPPGSRVCVLGSVPVMLDGSSPLAAHYVRARFERHFARLADLEHEYVPRDFYSGNTSLRSEVLRAVHGFDESFTTYGNEDVELWVRLNAAGVSFCFDSGARAHQKYDKDLRALAADTQAKARTAVLLARTHPEVFPALRLAAPRDNSRSWLCARAVLLAITRRWAATSGPIFRVAALLERLGTWRWPLFYRAVLDYAFWAGVDAELEALKEDGKLRELAADLHRGPIDLLLHG
jgi:glycosyltransferase involved in cell wall biosynthesis